MGWIISAGNMGKASLVVSSTPCACGARWRFIPNADRIGSRADASSPSWQTKYVWQSVLSTLVGND